MSSRTVSHRGSLGVVRVWSISVCNHGLAPEADHHAFDGHPQALRHAVDPDDASRAKHPGALHRELPDWAATPHSDRITRLDRAVLRGYV